MSSSGKRRIGKRIRIGTFVMFMEEFLVLDKEKWISGTQVHVCVLGLEFLKY